MSKIFTRGRRRALTSTIGVLMGLTAVVAGPAAARPAPADRAAVAASVVRFNAIWEPGGDGRPTAHTHTAGQLLQRNWAQGLRAWRINRYPHNGTFLYDAIWKPGTDGRRFVVDWTPAAFRAEDTRMRAQGYRLIQASGVKQPNAFSDDVRYVGIWMPGTDIRPTILGATWDEMIQANSNSWAIGYRIKYLNVYRTIGGGLRYDAIWEPGSDGRPSVTAWTFPELMAKNAELWAAGYRMTVVQPYLNFN
ncbi:hypothetical protein [Micromonospora sp. NBC_01796]|uniref:hypothetical protein n=1 Tax=Micromonospora sp. NBC_01796 TaxID=2975987 RepID=UPI002DDB4275|nr:hypothetical protein [Micromonospora sp. NBC_01796]WSA84861.1 hypothetical protein OIE47_31625 [Micromonospora sp. NBC_01796]